MLDHLERRFNGPVPRALRHGATIDDSTLRRRQALARARSLGRMAAVARADIAHLRRRAGAPALLERCIRRLAWARAEAEAWRRAA